MFLEQEIEAVGAEINAIRSNFVAGNGGSVPKDKIRLQADAEYEYPDDRTRFDWEEMGSGWTVVHRLSKALSPGLPFWRKKLKRAGKVHFINAFANEEDYFQCKGFYTTRKLVLKVSFCESNVPAHTEVWAEKICGWAVRTIDLPAPERRDGKVTYTFTPKIESKINDVCYRISWRFPEGSRKATDASSPA